MRCPHCGQRVFGVGQLPDYAVFSEGQRPIVKLLVDAYPESVTGLQMLDALGRGDTLEDAAIARKQIYTIRLKLRGSGWTVSRGAHNKAVYSRYALVRGE